MASTCRSLAVTRFTPSFTLYATVSGMLADPDINFRVYQPVLAEKLTRLIEQSVNYHYRAEPPLCGSCQREAV